MGEKGIGGAVAASVPGASSLIERTTTSVVTSVTGAGQDLVTAVQEKAVGAFADEAIKAARERFDTADPTDAIQQAAAEEDTEPPHEGPAPSDR